MWFAEDGRKSTYQSSLVDANTLCQKQHDADQRESSHDASVRYSKLSIFDIVSRKWNYAECVWGRE